MRVIVVFACLVASVVTADKYSSKYDNFDVDTLINNDRLLNAYVNCFLDKGRCTPEGADFKKALPEAIETTCGKCSDKQKGNIRRVIKAIQKKHAKQWDDLVKKNDPTGTHRDNFEKFIQGS
uniref:Putative chemosensory protein 6 n=1 Tax=Ectropis obliqua TaxID=248899 RepID=A0A1W5LAR7_ECTOB|nr:putative chemosensory protein 6 [Ectropis obliqua]